MTAQIFALLLLSQFALAAKIHIATIRGFHGNPHDQTDDLAPPNTGGAPPAGTTGPLSPISFHGGPILNAPNIYLIFYGDWSTGADAANGGKQIAIDFVTNLGGSGWMSIVSVPPYTGPGGFATTNLLGTVTSADIGWATSAGKLKPARQTSLSSTDVIHLVQYYISTTPSKTKDPNGLYFILSSSGVRQSNGGAQGSMCTKYCGWHSSSGGIRFGWIGNPVSCLNACAPQSPNSPNNNPGVDAVVNLLSHEIIEAITDPDLNAWYDASGYENADKCAWTFGAAQYQTANGASANVHLGSRDFLIQRNLGIDSKCYIDGQTKQQ